MRVQLKELTKALSKLSYDLSPYDGEKIEEATVDITIMDENIDGAQYVSCMIVTCSTTKKANEYRKETNVVRTLEVFGDSKLPSKLTRAETHIID